MGEDYRAFVARLFATKNTGTEGALHAALGLAGETGELIDLLKKEWVQGKDIGDKLMLELGDIDFYLTALGIVLEVDFKAVLLNDEDKEGSVMRSAVRMLDKAADILGRGEAARAQKSFAALEGMRGVVQGYQYWFTAYLYAVGISRGVVRERNQAKLNARYPNGYSNAAALARRDEDLGDA